MTNGWFQRNLYLFSPLPRGMVQFDSYFSLRLKPPDGSGAIRFSSESLLITRWWFQLFFMFTPEIGEDEPI